MNELFEQTKRYLFKSRILKEQKFTKQIAFNVIPHIGPFLENGNTQEEQKMINETKKILDPNISLCPQHVFAFLFLSVTVSQ